MNPATPDWSWLKNQSGEVEIFVAHALDERSAPDVAAEHDVSLWAVYRTTRKCSELLARNVEVLEQSYEADA
jgi:hypothetical protein